MFLPIYAEFTMSAILTSERLTAIEQRLAREGRVLAADLAREFDTSEDTIRRDLRTLAAAGRCRRVYGGALPVAPRLGPVSARETIAPEAKAALGAALATLIEPGMTVFLDVGSTNLACARALTARNVTIVTHTPAIAAILAETLGLSLVTIGGHVDPVVGAAIGAKALGEIEGLRFDLVILGACGLDAEAGVTVHSVEDAAFKRAICARADAVAVAAGRDKLGTAAAFPVIGINACDTLVLEGGAPGDALAPFRSLGPKILEVEMGA